MKTALALYHIDFEKLGTLEPVLAERGYQLEYINACTADLTRIDASEPELLIILGGPMGVDDGDLYPFMKTELELVKRRLESGKPLLGICLGAQFIARAAGAAVKPSGVKEIGFVPIKLTPEGEASPLAALKDTPVLHWHGDAFAIPDQAVHLASTDICATQAFSLGDNVLALQFHLEADPQHIERWLVGHNCEISGAGIDPRDIRRQAGQATGLAAKAREVLSAWLNQLGPGSLA
ncbi:glutamine amidotransferase [Gilvimarinus xylanilyticus]|uniref:Glutamine amidotransferase n=1 Tax=Gilvimarinus xylanilyticus TaxID=2944139 RepID=A0A9X2KX59_9GAMM|nr:glutamine amidotransferase [Gilvimarinus xylanilyticus]MCP8900930.1 glutamine amidotransferase [Gilvimarinus xylanilyticus]